MGTERSRMVEQLSNMIGPISMPPQQQLLPQQPNLPQSHPYISPQMRTTYVPNAPNPAPFLGSSVSPPSLTTSASTSASSSTNSNLNDLINTRSPNMTSLHAVAAPLQPPPPPTVSSTSPTLSPQIQTVDTLNPSRTSSLESRIAALFNINLNMPQIPAAAQSVPPLPPPPPLPPLPSQPSPPLSKSQPNKNLNIPKKDETVSTTIATTSHPPQIPVDTEQLKDQSLKLIVTELKEVLRKDLTKKLVEQYAFKLLDEFNPAQVNTSISTVTSTNNNNEDSKYIDNNNNNNKSSYISISQPIQSETYSKIPLILSVILYRIIIIIINM